MAAKKDLKNLTERQRRILEFISDCVKLRGYPPSIREICDAVGLNSTSSVAYQLRELERKGFVRRDPHKPRTVNIREDKSINALSSQKKPGPKPRKDRDSANTLELPEHLDKPTYVPIVGQIAAGAPILAEQNIEDHMALPRQLVGDGDLYMLRVVGESMVDAGIFDGDWVVVRSQQSAEQGDFVAAMIDEEATVKEWVEDATGRWLYPHNDNFSPISAERATILGKVVSVLRRL